jgi:hypothetical protein
MTGRNLTRRLTRRGGVEKAQTSGEILARRLTRRAPDEHGESSKTPRISPDDSSGVRPVSPIEGHTRRRPHVCKTCDVGCDAGSGQKRRGRDENGARRVRVRGSEARQKRANPSGRETKLTHRMACFWPSHESHAFYTFRFAFHEKPIKQVFHGMFHGINRHARVDCCGQTRGQHGVTHCVMGARQATVHALSCQDSARTRHDSACFAGFRARLRKRTSSPVRRHDRKSRSQRLEFTRVYGALFQAWANAFGMAVSVRRLVFSGNEVAS